MALPDKNDFAALGGELVDYSPPEDPTTDLSAEASNEARADTAAMTRMIERAFVSFTTNGSTATVTDHDAVWGNALAYKPTISRTGAGNYLVTWPTTVTDARGVTRSLNLRFGVGNVGESLFSASVIRVSANSMRIRITRNNAATDPDASTVVTMVVW
ncbi:hypothetical protein BE20_24860 [Sorangium cellulosum]|uniref:Uncharacterized protein n=1 Tax=Sorangium cellulosum TaxID=56 RepID=A0A150S5N8_SORCE|nr:hypothetical protein BE20_24860 [Sorangium cellulosum]KYF89287.1 hypothetical protein BE18_22910 [Sorangium cellulosum]